MSAVSDLAPARLRRADAAGLLTRLRRWRLRANGRHLLLGFDERMLRDLGICRGEAEFEGRKPFWRE